jgi:hypothetical protein
MKSSLQTHRKYKYIAIFACAVIIHNLGVHLNIIWMIPLGMVTMLLTVVLYVKLNPRFYQKSGEQKAACARSYGEPKEER